jgi:exodeoxyribonuclease V alpha subunit
VEVTGRDSMTIAAFIRALENGSKQVGPSTIVVVDEASMIDAMLMFKLLRNIIPGTRLILVGDPSQLPPIGPGLVFQALAGCQNIPQTMLKVTKRQSLESGIPHIANAIRCHEIPTFANYVGIGCGVSFISCSDNLINATVVQTYRELGGTGCNFSIQILSATNNGYGGVEGLNSFLHTTYRENAEHVQRFDPVFGVVNVLTKKGRLSLKVGDLVMFTKNDYDLDLRNGSLGIIVEAFPILNSKSLCCVCKFDGVFHNLNSEQVSALQHAYAITVHKSQGSQFKRVIIPIRKNKLLDQALVYTAVTRAVEQVVFVGNYEAILTAIEAPASVTQRHVRLPLLMAEQMR